MSINEILANNTKNESKVTQLYFKVDLNEDINLSKKI